ncbi:ead/Ea22-like family protein [Citrobacter portucalensis]|uniref:Ead/Ea22-like family protein n=1 Tax=Citrobacter portucalensis TaxID=1639133 RepID=A0ABZ0H4T8_9ENTR|nr:ead/Ea22-like family protein [Citrobacter portucalensis]MEB2741406.1 ead/Ea22-like family protein [Citrobacter portucalensis]WOH45300.1 ead/Ea22-like family protein [Citrobacter portucalensis]
MTALNKQALREAAQEEIMLRSVSDTSDAWQDEASPEAVLALLDELEAAEKRLAELEAKLDSADKLQDSAFRHGLQHGFSLGQTDNQAGFEECLSAYGTGKGE